MKQYYIKLKQGESLALLPLLCRHLKIREPEALQLLSWGSVWDNTTNIRLKTPDLIISRETILVQRPDFPVRPYPFSPEDIFYEDEHFFAVYKRPFFPTVPTPYADINSLVFGLNRYLEEYRPGEQALVVNRLDLDTRGLVLLAKRKKAEAALHRLFKERCISKWYLARTPAFENPQHRYLIHDELSWKGKVKSAWSQISLLGEDTGSFCFLVRPRTGRTHQIRKHFRKYIRPIVGDNVYGDYTWEDRLELCCFCYIFRHPFTDVKLKLRHVPEDWGAGVHP